MAVDHAPGHRRWFIPDCYLPADPPDKGNFMSHESCCILNAGQADAHCRLTLYFEDRERVRYIQVTVEAERCWHIRFDRLEEIAGARIPRDVPYGLGVESDHKVVVVITLDTSGLVAIISPTDPHHQEAAAVLRKVLTLDRHFSVVAQEGTITVLPGPH